LSAAACIVLHPLNADAIHTKPQAANAARVIGEEQNGIVHNS